MGQTLSEPETQKYTSHGGDDRLLFAVSEMQGWRLSMEDAHATILNLDNEDESAEAQCGAGKKGKTSFFAVYDGHGGSTVAKYSGETVHKRLRALDLYKDKEYQKSLTRAFLKTDEDIRANPDYAHETSGCTAVAALITEDNTIIVANAGDSRSVLSIAGEAKPMSYDHKPVNKGENSRIVAAGGFVEFGRVNGNLALSRALGDFEFKQNQNLDAEHQIVTADPDVITHSSTAEDEFLVIACDGIWDVLKNQEVVDYVRRSIAERKELHEICEQLMDRCLAPDSDWGGVGCDNMTVLIVGLLNGRTKEEWYDWVAERVEKGVGHATPTDLPEPFSNRGPPGRPGLTGSGPLSGPAQMLSNAINNGTLRFDRGGEEDGEEGENEMDTDEDQYHKSPSAMDSDKDSNEGDESAASGEATTSSSTSGSKPVPINSSAAPEKLSSTSSSDSTSNYSHGSILSPPSAVMGVHTSATSRKANATKNSGNSASASGSGSASATKPNANKDEQDKDDEIPHPAVQADGLMDASEGPLSG